MDVAMRQYGYVMGASCDQKHAALRAAKYAHGITSFSHLPTRKDVDDGQQVFCKILFICFVIVFFEYDNFSSCFCNQWFDKFESKPAKSVPVGNNNFSDIAL